MQHTVTVSQDQLNRIENHLKNLERVMLRLVTHVTKHEEETDEDLNTFFDQVHNKLPDFPQEKAEENILVAIKAVRKGK